ncbi:predicted protein [Plenodomus lingam JN3]|uniref:Predicted protein n=1 Tax=Leptosphaeria maculans (strain JN3 / isolate v23.1.3 / race Av1-4-5-6-7-8) TaxID=985895 RepID=E5AFR6_LEPMJ|nr:predicted protein [Plenodomus lingam JN3]CBY02055.1 predicted protein [Plenodomus lingam JN3]
MPSTPLDSGWDFSPVIDLIDSDVQDTSSPKLTPKPRPLASVLQNEGGIRLGSFAKVFENLGLTQDAPSLPPLDSESELSTSDEVLLPSPVLQAAQTPVELEETEDSVAATALTKKQRQKARRKAEKEQQEELLKTKSFQEELQMLVNAAQAERKPTEAASPSKPSRTPSRSNVGAKCRASNPVSLPNSVVPVIAPTSPQKPKTPKPPRPSILKRPSSMAQPVTPTPQPVRPVENISIVQDAPVPVQYSTSGTSAPTQHSCNAQLQPYSPQANTSTEQYGLIPSNVRPVAMLRGSQRAVAQLPSTPTPVALSPPAYATPMGPRTQLVIRSQVDRHLHFLQKLLHCFPDDRKWLVSPMQLINERTSSHGLHVFVDASNIMIGFKDMLRYRGIQPYQYDMSFDSLALLMERRRPVAKRVFAGSQREANPLPHVTKLVETSKAVGYDSVMQEQVLISREDSKKKFYNDVKKHGWQKAAQLRSGSGSDSETGALPASKTPSAPKWVEQGVDEILHLKMCQSIIDSEVPSTMVVATGDGAEAEMSDGFLAHVERALKKGWKVELISWRQQMNGGYKNRKFRAKWADRFQIIELDAFLEDLIDTP